MPDLSQSQMKRLTAIHGWSAVILGLLLYAVIVTGAVAVFAEEIGRWSAGTVRTLPAMEGPVDARIRALAEQVAPEHREDVSAWNAEGGDMHVFFHTHKLNPETGLDEDFGTIFRVGPAGETIERHDGFVWNDPRAYDVSALRHFLVDLHVQLYLPSPWGLILTGVLGLMMMAAVVSGLLMHRHIIRDLFVAERPGKRLVSARDRHVLAASWGLPFAFVLAFTGSFFSFASTVGFPLVAAVAFGGDQEAMSETLFEPPVPEDARRVPQANLDRLMADSAGRAGPPTFVSVAHYGRADSRVEIWHDPSAGGLAYVTNVYEGTSGAYLGRRATVGTEPSLGGTLYGLMYPLHFGHFAGILSKVVWGALGVSMAFVVLSGFRIWLQRRAQTPAWIRFGRAVEATAYGLPFAMIASAWGFFLTRPAADPFFWTPLSFVAGAAVAIWLGTRTPDRARLGRLFRRLLGAGCLGLPALRLATGGMDWAEALIHGQTDVLSMDLTLLVAGACLWFWPPQGFARRRIALEPAE